MRIPVEGTELYVDVDGPQIEVRGQDVIERPTLVALHGGPGFDHVQLKPALGPLRAHAQIVYVDLRGQGRSGRPPIETCTLEQTADDVAGLCGRLGIERPVVLGHSAGGFVALHLAVRHPEVAGGLVLCSTAPTLEPISDGEPAPSLADRAGPEATEVAARLFGGDMSPDTMEAFARLVAPFYAGPAHMEVPLVPGPKHPARRAAPPRGSGTLLVRRGSGPVPRGRGRVPREGRGRRGPVTYTKDGGRWKPNPSCSVSSAARSRSDHSCCQRPASWTPTGSPSCRPAGTDTAGVPAKLTGSMNCV